MKQKWLEIGTQTALTRKTHFLFHWFLPVLDNILILHTCCLISFPWHTIWQKQTCVLTKRRWSNFKSKQKPTFDHHSCKSSLSTFNNLSLLFFACSVALLKPCGQNPHSSLVVRTPFHDIQSNYVCVLFWGFCAVPHDFPFVLAQRGGGMKNLQQRRAWQQEAYHNFFS